MKNIIKILIGFLLGISACSKRQENSKEIHLITQNSLYKISFNKPLELDTFYTWMNWNDNACSDARMYRFSRRGFPPQKEAGFVDTSFADSTYRITIKHVEKFACKYDDDFGNELKLSEHIRDLELGAQNRNQPIKILYLKQVKINDREFKVWAYSKDEKFKNGYWTHYLQASTIIDNNSILISADCRTKNCNGFLDRMEKTFYTIKIKKNKDIH